MQISNCRACKNTDSLIRFLDLGMHPPSDAFLSKTMLNDTEAKYPLDVFFCANCSLVQLGYIVPPEEMFNEDYVYVTSVSKTMVEHFYEFAEHSMMKFGNPNSLVVEMGSNDGTLLKSFKSLGSSVMGVDPSHAATIAIENGIPTINSFFSEKIAEKIASENGKARILAGANVFAHINDWKDVILGAKRLLEKNGVLIFEFPYLKTLVEDNQFDQIYHEHLSYISIGPLVKLFKEYEMELFDVKQTPIHNGSIRIFVKRKEGKWSISNRVEDIIRSEKDLGLYEANTFFELSKRVENFKDNFRKLLLDLKSQGKKIIGNGAAAKGNTLLNYCNIGTDILDFIVDPNPIKHDTYTPGMHIPVFPLSKVSEERPDYMVILPWNFKDVIMSQETRIREWGGKFIVPLPSPEIL